MIWYIVTETANLYRKRLLFFEHKLTLEDLSGDVCLLLHYSQLSTALFKGTKPWAICHSGSSTDYAEYDILQNPLIHECITQWDIAQIGFCGGHQVISAHFGSTLGPMRRLRPGEPDLFPGYNPGQYKEWGMYTIQITRSDPIFLDMGSTIQVQEYHYWEIKELAPGLVTLAESENCKVQAFKHGSRPIYGVQFHPEQASPAYPDGYKLLRNFFQLARDYHQGVSEG